MIYVQKPDKCVQTTDNHETDIYFKVVGVVNSF